MITLVAANPIAPIEPPYSIGPVIYHPITARPPIPNTTPEVFHPVSARGPPFPVDPYVPVALY